MLRKIEAGIGTTCSVIGKVYEWISRILYSMDLNWTSRDFYLDPSGLFQNKEKVSSRVKKWDV
jgi:hypothetical protein